MSKPKLTRAENIDRAVRLILNHGAPYRAVAKHCGLPNGTVSYEVHKYRKRKGLIPTRAHGRTMTPAEVAELENFHK